MGERRKFISTVMDARILMSKTVMIMDISIIMSIIMSTVLSTIMSGVTNTNTNAVPPRNCMKTMRLSIIMGMESLAAINISNFQRFKSRFHRRGIKWYHLIHIPIIANTAIITMENAADTGSLLTTIAMIMLTKNKSMRIRTPLACVLLFFML